MLIEPQHHALSIVRQCQLIGLPRSGYYYHPKEESPENLAYLRIIDEQYLRTPFFGSRMMTAWMIRQGYSVNRKRVQRLMRKMGIQGTVPGPHTSKPHPEHTIYPYLLRGLDLSYANLVWSTDFTYVPLPTGFMYLVAVIDWYSRYVLSWELSNTMDYLFCVSALQAALTQGEPGIFNTDQGSQFTTSAFTQHLLNRQILISMDGRGRAFDNIMIERLWRTVKYEDVYLQDYEHFFMARESLENYFGFYNEERRHSSLGKRTPSAVYWADRRGQEQAV